MSESNENEIWTVEEVARFLKMGKSAVYSLTRRRGKVRSDSRLQRRWDMGKRTTSVTVKMTAEDFTLLQKAADTIWAKAVLTRSSIVLGLARIGAESVLKKK
jgi:hypothetical protein